MLALKFSVSFPQWKTLQDTILVSCKHDKLHFVFLNNFKRENDGEAGEGMVTYNCFNVPGIRKHLFSTALYGTINSKTCFFLFFNE